MIQTLKTQNLISCYFTSNSKINSFSAFYYLQMKLILFLNAPKLSISLITPLYHTPQNDSRDFYYCLHSFKNLEV
jgi:hypothetical protein